MTPQEMIGREFGKLTVLLEAGRNNSRSILYRCSCDCGGITSVTGSNLRKGSTISCGCAKKEDLSGKTFGLLTAIEDVGRRNKEVLWRCRCECGTIVDVRSSNLKSGNTTTCGCSKRGKSHYNWKGGAVNRDIRDRKSFEYINWRLDIFKRDGLLFTKNLR